jgi:Tfp pilus assembly protein PilO
MMDFRNKEELPTNLVMLVSMLALVGVLLFVLLVPKPTVAGMRSQRQNREFEIKREHQTVERQLVEVRGHVATYVWDLPLQQVSPAALANVTTSVQARNLRLIAFRPQRVAESTGGLSQIPFMITVEGTFPNVAQFVDDLESPANRLAVNLVQISASDGATDQVSASIGVLAFVAPKEARVVEAAR